MIGLLFYQIAKKKAERLAEQQEAAKLREDRLQIREKNIKALTQRPSMTTL